MAKPIYDMPKPTNIHTIDGLLDNNQISFFETSTIVGSRYFIGDYVIDISTNKLYIVRDISEYKKDGYDGYVINISFFAILPCNIWVDSDKKILNEYIIRKTVEEINDKETRNFCMILIISLIILCIIAGLIIKSFLIISK